MKSLFPATRLSIVFQYICGIIHVQNVLFSRLFMNIFPNNNVYIFDYALNFSLMYFALDIFFIVIYEYKNQRIYVFHHIIAILMGSGIKLRYFDMIVASNYITIVELSNVFLSVWDLCRRNRKYNNFNAIGYRILTPMMLVSYVPIRVCAVPWATYVLIKTMHSTNLFSHSLQFGLILIIGMSYFFSWKIVSIATKRRGC